MEYSSWCADVLTYAEELMMRTEEIEKNEQFYFLKLNTFLCDYISYQFK